MNCEETREHLESCEDCRLHVSVEARLRTQPLLDPPPGLVDRVMRALPRKVPLRREVFRLVAAAALLVVLSGTVLASGLHHHPALSSLRPQVETTFRALESTFSLSLQE